MDANARMPGDSEAAAAATGMQEVYGHAAAHAIGDSLWFCPTVGSMPREGKVIELGRHGSLVMQEPTGETHLITPSQLAEF